MWNLERGEENPLDKSASLLAIGVLAIYGSYAYLAVELQPVEPWREDGRAIFQFEQEHPDMFGYTVWMQERFSETPMTDDYESPDYQEVNGFNTTLERLSILQGRGVVRSNYSQGSRFGGEVEMRTPGVVRVNLAYFPGWQVTMDGRPVEHRVSPPDGLIELDVPAGEHKIDVVMGMTPVRQAGEIISWTMAALVVALLLWPMRRPAAT